MVNPLTGRVPCTCWNCGAVNDAATGIGDTDPGLPDNGDRSICAYCAALSIFTRGGTDTRPATPAELDDAMTDPVIVKAVAAVRSADGWAHPRLGPCPR